MLRFRPRTSASSRAATETFPRSNPFHRRKRATTGLILLSLSTLIADGAQRFRVTVIAREVDRAEQVVELTLPEGLGLNASLFDSSERAVPLQVESDRSARFIVARQKAGEAARFTLTAGAPATLTTGVQVIEETAPQAPTATTKPDYKAAESITGFARKPSRLKLSVAGSPALYYQMETEAGLRDNVPAHSLRAGFLHPLLTPLGKIVSENSPASSPDQPGLWSWWTQLSFQNRQLDFTGHKPKSGQIEFVQLDRTWNGPVDGGFSAWQRFVDDTGPAPITVLNETWQVTLYHLPELGAAETTAMTMRMFDVAITQVNPTSDPVIFSPTIEGGLSFRGRSDGLKSDSLVFLDALKETDVARANGSTPHWAYLGAARDGGMVGTALLAHPDNFHAAQQLGTRAGEAYLNFHPAAENDWSIEPGKSLTLRYRVLVTDGAPDAPGFEACWNGYILPAEVKIEQVR